MDNSSSKNVEWLDSFFNSYCSFQDSVEEEEQSMLGFPFISFAIVFRSVIYWCQNFSTNEGSQQLSK